MAATIDVTELIDRHKIGRFHVTVLVLCFLVLVVDGYDAQSIGFAAPAIAGTWHVAKAAFGSVFASGLLGMAVGALLFGALADRFGRKTMIIFCVLFFGVFTFAKAMTGSLLGLRLMQFVAGLGVGGAMPNAIALVSEYSPRRLRATMVTIGSCGFALGSGGGGVLASYLLPRFGWKSVFIVGGAMPFVVAVLLLLALPESVSLLVLQKRSGADIARILNKIAPTLSITSDTPFLVREKKSGGVPVQHLFRDGRAGRTSLLWLAVIMDLMVIYFMLSWLPMLMHNTGLPLDKAVRAAAMFSSAGLFGTLVVGRLMDWIGPHRMLAISFAVAAVFIALIASSTSFGVLQIAIICAGFFAVGGHNGIGAYAGQLYPTFIRSTGVGWALGMGRIGSLVSPVIGGMLIAWHWKMSAIFYLVAVPPALCAIAILLIGKPPVLEVAPLPAGVPTKEAAAGATS